MSSQPGDVCEVEVCSKARPSRKKGGLGYGGFRIAAGGWCQSWLTLLVAPGVEKKIIGKRNPPSLFSGIYFPG